MAWRQWEVAAWAGKAISVGFYSQHTAANELKCSEEAPCIDWHLRICLHVSSTYRSFYKTPPPPRGGRLSWEEYCPKRPGTGPPSSPAADFPRTLQPRPFEPHLASKTPAWNCVWEALGESSQ